MFHEAAHSLVSPVSGPLAEGIAHASIARNRPAPHDLWHVVLFYTVGEIVRRTLRDHGVSDYIPFAYHQDLYDHVPGWKYMQHGLECHWRRYLDGTIELDLALAYLIQDLP